MAYSNLNNGIFEFKCQGARLQILESIRGRIYNLSEGEIYMHTDCQHPSSQKNTPAKLGKYAGKLKKSCSKEIQFPVENSLYPTMHWVRVIYIHGDCQHPPLYSAWCSTGSWHRDSITERRSLCSPVGPRSFYVVSSSSWLEKIGFPEYFPKFPKNISKFDGPKVLFFGQI